MDVSSDPERQRRESKSPRRTLPETMIVEERQEANGGPLTGQLLITNFAFQIQNAKKHESAIILDNFARQRVNVNTS